MHRGVRVQGEALLHCEPVSASEVVRSEGAPEWPGAAAPRSRPQYVCSGTFNAGSKYCVSFGGRCTDARFGEEVLRALSPLGLRASVEAAVELGRGDEEKEKALGRQVEQLDYEAKRAFEQYNEVDPRNRLVATELERRWNEKLKELEGARGELTTLVSSRPVVTEQQREDLLALGEHFEAVWNNAACPVELKKRIVRTIVEEVVVDEVSKGKLKFIVHWKGGTHTSFELARQSAGAAQKTADEDPEIIRKMAARYGDDAIARVLNKLGRWCLRRHTSSSRKSSEEPPP